MGTNMSVPRWIKERDVEIQRVLKYWGIYLNIWLLCFFCFLVLSSFSYCFLFGFFCFQLFQFLEFGDFWSACCCADCCAYCGASKKISVEFKNSSQVDTQSEPTGNTVGGQIYFIKTEISSLTEYLQYLWYLWYLIMNYLTLSRMLNRSRAWWNPQWKLHINNVNYVFKTVQTYIQTLY